MISHINKKRDYRSNNAGYEWKKNYSKVLKRIIAEQKHSECQKLMFGDEKERRESIIQ